MTKTRKIVWLIVAVCVCVTLAFIATVPNPGVTKENFDRIEIGMTRAEVEEIFGGKGPPSGGINDGVKTGERWDSEEGKESAFIVFSDNDIVVEKEWRISR